MAARRSGPERPLARRAAQAPQRAGNNRARSEAMLTEAGHAVRQSMSLAQVPSGPVRMCVGCRERADRSDLLRVVARLVDGFWAVVPDERRRLPGRGAWLHPAPGCLELAERRRAFARALRRSEPLNLAGLRQYVATGRRPGS